MKLTKKAIPSSWLIIAATFFFNQQTAKTFSPNETVESLAASSSECLWQDVKTKEHICISHLSPFAGQNSALLHSSPNHYDQTPEIRFSWVNLLLSTTHWALEDGFPFLFHSVRSCDVMTTRLLQASSRLNQKNISLISCCSDQCRPHRHIPVHVPDACTCACVHACTHTQKQHTYTTYSVFADLKLCVKVCFSVLQWPWC